MSNLVESVVSYVTSTADIKEWKDKLLQFVGGALVMAQTELQDLMGPSWKYIATTIITLGAGGIVAYMTYSASLMSDIRSTQSAQAEQIETLRTLIRSQERAGENQDKEIKSELKEQREDIKEMHGLLNQINVRLARGR